MLFTPNNINDDIKGILSWNDRGAPPLRLRACTSPPTRSSWPDGEYTK
jgi:hypothetical protein